MFEDYEGKGYRCNYTSLLCIPFTAWKESKVKDFPVSIFSEEADGEYDQKLKYTAFYLMLRFG